MAPAFKDDQLMIIAPGSQTTLAQLGLPESLTPARYRFRSCMFPAEKAGEFEPNKVRRKVKSATNGAPAEGDAPKDESTEQEAEYEEDFVSEEGAVWPLKAGQIVDWPCFFALVSYIYNTINPPFHTPVLFIAEPIWTPRELEKITQFFFEKFKIPAFAILDSAIATSYGYGLENATIVDVGQDKADVSAIAGFMLHTTGRAASLADCGGEAMTQRLQELLGSKKFTRDMCEQLKKSNICEILPSDADIPTATGAANEKTHGNPAAAASTGGNEPTSTATVSGTRAAGEDAGVMNDKADDNDEGVLDIASIVTGGKMNEFLESKEKEKAEKAEKAAAKKKGDAAAAATAKAQRLPNSKRYKNTFVYDDKALHNALKEMNVSGDQVKEMQAVMDGATAKSTGENSQSSGPMKREIEVGIERFQAASGGILDRLADAVYRTVSSVEEVERRSDLWNSLVIVGNGSKVRGFKEALLSRLQSKYQISPSSATIFTSELPSNMSTPFATGMNSPQPGMMGAPGMHPPGVNPLLYAATTAQAPHLNQMGQSMYAPMPEHRHSSHGQTPTSIKLAKIPEYFPEWKDAGYEEASFLGAQVAAKVLFTVDTGPSKAYMTRSDYNEQGPQGIHEYGL